MNLFLLILNFVQQNFGPSDFLFYLFLHTYIHTYIPIYLRIILWIQRIRITFLCLRGKERTGLSPI